MIDISIAKYWEEATANGKDDTLYFPTEFYDWLKSDDKHFKQMQLRKITSRLNDFSNLQQILAPVHLPNHWGLICIELADMEIYFDDGLASVPPRTALPAAKELLNLLAEMNPLYPLLQSKFWHQCNRFKRFGMPSQAPVDSRMIGVGSCGVGVIMAARDFLENGSSCINNFKWRYCDMHLHRKNLMLQILSWST